MSPRGDQNDAGVETRFGMSYGPSREMSADSGGVGRVGPREYPERAAIEDLVESKPNVTLFCGHDVV